MNHSHAYAPTFIGVGLDAYVDAVKDFSFRNNRPDPIKIKATVANGVLSISIVGVETRDYTVEIVVKGLDTPVTPGILYNYMLPDCGYENGYILYAGANGYNIEVYRALYDKVTEDPEPKPRLETFVDAYSYAPQDSIVVQIQQVAPAPVDPALPGV